MRDLQNKSCLTLFEKLFSLYFETDTIPDEYPHGAMDELKRKYQLDEIQVKVLAYLNHSYPTRIIRSKILSIIIENDGLPNTILSDLLDRKFIVKSNTVNSDSCYTLSGEFHAAAQKNEPFGVDFPVSCFEALQKTSPSDFLSETWRERFYDTFSKPENLRFVNAHNDLSLELLDDDTQSVFWIMVSFFMKRFTTPFAFTGDSYVPDENYGNAVTIKICMANLVKAGLAISMPIDSLDDSHETERYVLSPRAVQALFHGCDELARYDEISKVTNVILAKDIVEKKLFFSEASQVDVDNLRKVLSEDGFKRAECIMKRQHRNPAIQSLFWGPPGTGKTEVIKQIARETGRDLLLFDAAKVTASAWGASEKNYRTLFLGYNYLVAICTKAPILLLNECDQLLAKRLTTMERAIDRCENTVSNIILQGFEDMSGILLATTNLATNLDSAFDRRFLFKTELTKPDAKARKCIWQSLVPELSESEAQALAERFEMTGGQISNVVAKRDLAELYYEGDRGLDYIVGLCKTELNEPTKGPRARRVGF